MDEVPDFSNTGDVKILRPVDVCLSTWCDAKLKNEEVTALITRVTDDRIELLEKYSLNECNGHIKFRTEVLSTFVVFIPKIVYEKIVFHIEFSWFLNTERNTFTVVYLRKELIVMGNELHDIMENDILLYTGRITVENGDKIAASVSGEGFEDSITYTSVPSSVGFVINEDFFQKPYKSLRMRLQPKPLPQQIVELDFKISQNDIDVIYAKNITWPEAPPNITDSVMDEED